MSVSKKRFFSRRRLTQLVLLSLVLIGLIIVGNYTYFSIRHDMVLMTTKQPNVFEVFYQRARILTPAMLRQFIEQSDNKQPIFSGNYSALAFVYGYERPCCSNPCGLNGTN